MCHVTLSCSSFCSAQCDGMQWLHVVTQCYGQLQVDKCSDPFRVHGVCHMLLRPVGPVTGAWACASACRDFERFHGLKQGSTGTAVKSRSLAWDSCLSKWFLDGITTHGQVRQDCNGTQVAASQCAGFMAVGARNCQLYLRLPVRACLYWVRMGTVYWAISVVSIILSSHAVCVRVYRGSSEVMK